MGSGWQYLGSMKRPSAAGMKKPSAALAKRPSVKQVRKKGKDPEPDVFTDVHVGYSIAHRDRSYYRDETRRIVATLVPGHRVEIAFRGKARDLYERFDCITCSKGSCTWKGTATYDPPTGKLHIRCVDLNRHWICFFFSANWVWVTGLDLKLSRLLLIVPRFSSVSCS